MRWLFKTKYMKTAMQEFIEYLEDVRVKDQIPSWVINTAKNHLEMERMQIINACHACKIMQGREGDKTPKEYYEDTFSDNTM